MKKICIMLILMIVVMLSGCKEVKPHWSYKACVEEIVTENEIEAPYEYVVKEIRHNEYQYPYEEIHCFDITFIFEDASVRYCCFAVIVDGEVFYVDCDLWEGN